jgi:hypothetical protein
MVTLILALALAIDSPPPTAEASIAGRVVEARKACAAGRVDQGVEILAGIIAQTGDMNALYNQARCYQLNGRPEPAIARFREYLRSARDISAEERKRVEGFIKELDADLEARARRESLIRAAAAAPAVAPDRAASTSHRLRVASLALAASGGVALIAGGYFSWKMARVADDLESQWSLTSAQFKQRWNDGKRFELLARVGYGVGAAALVGSAACYLLGRRAAVRERRVALAPLVLAGGGGGELRLVF